MDVTLIVVAVLVLAVLASIAKAFGVGRTVERAQAERDRAEAEAIAAVERSRMQAEADAIYRDTLGLSEAELEEELKRWSELPR